MQTHILTPWQGPEPGDQITTANSEARWAQPSHKLTRRWKLDLRKGKATKNQQTGAMMDHVQLMRENARTTRAAWKRTAAESLQKVNT